MIKVGVNDPIFIEKLLKNEKGSLVITWKEGDKAVKKKVSLFDAMSESSDASGSTEGQLEMLIFPPSREYQNEPLEPTRLVENLMKLKNQFTHILKRYTTEKNIVWKPFAGIPVTSEEALLEQVQKEEVFLKIYANLVDQFIEFGKKFKIEDSTKLSRLFLVRQSKEKHYGKLRDSYLDSRPFLEDVLIPKDKSKLYVKAGTKGATTYFEPDAEGYIPNFDPYEISKGRDNPIQSASTADAPTNTAEEAAQVEGLFGAAAGTPEAPIDFGAAPEPEGGMQFGAPDEVSEVPGMTDESEPEDDEDNDQEVTPAGDTFSPMDRAQLKAFIKDNGLSDKIKVLKSDSDEALRDKIREEVLNSPDFTVETEEEE